MIGRVLAIDPGYEQSAFVVYDPNARAIEAFGIELNDRMRLILDDPIHMLGSRGAFVDRCAIEKIAMGGMVAGQETFDTAMWVGRFVEVWERNRESKAVLVRRMDEKMHLCHDSRAKDANIRQALIDKFGPGKDKAIGKKATPGPLFGITADVWAALAIAVTYVEGGVRNRT